MLVTQLKKDTFEHFYRPQLKQKAESAKGKSTFLKNKKKKNFVDERDKGFMLLTELWPLCCFMKCKVFLWCVGHEKLFSETWWVFVAMEIANG